MTPGETITLSDFPRSRVKTHISRRENGSVYIRFENPTGERDVYLESHQLQQIARKAQELTTP